MGNEIQKAVEYLEATVKESDEIIGECSPALQEELIEQKGHFVVAIAALERQKPKPPALKVLEKYRALGENYYCECGVMFVDYERNGTDYCGNCGQRLRELEEGIVNAR